MTIRQALAAALLLTSAGQAQALRCGSNLVDVGDADHQVLRRCGEPYWIDRYVDVETIGPRRRPLQEREVAVEAWYYNFGPRRFISRLVFRDGRLVADETLGYGVGAIGGRCEPNRDYAGLSAGELYAYCGEPTLRRRNAVTDIDRPARDLEIRHERRDETWIYDFGSDRFLRSLRIVEGRVSGSETLPR